jgi:hypothetical protein
MLACDLTDHRPRCDRCEILGRRPDSAVLAAKLIERARAR